MDREYICCTTHTSFRYFCVIRLQHKNVLKYMLTLKMRKNVKMKMIHNPLKPPYWCIYPKKLNSWNWIQCINDSRGLISSKIHQKRHFHNEGSYLLFGYCRLTHVFEVRLDTGLGMGMDFCLQQTQKTISYLLWIALLPAAVEPIW